MKRKKPLRLLLDPDTGVYEEDTEYDKLKELTLRVAQHSVSCSLALVCAGFFVDGSRITKELEKTNNLIKELKGGSNEKDGR